MEKENVLIELKKNVQEDKFLKIVFSDRQGGEFNKIIMKPISLKTCKNIQIESFKDNKAFHKNIELNNFQEIENVLKEYIENFKQILLQIENFDVSFIRKKESFIKRENKNNLIKNSNEHNKKKQYIFFFHNTSYISFKLSISKLLPMITILVPLASVIGSISKFLYTRLNFPQ